MQISLFSILLISTASALPGYLSQIPKIARRDNTGPNLGVLGDSWGSGVSFDNETTYDQNKDECLRWGTAYASQLERDRSWSENKSNAMQFVACSGSALVDIVQRQRQMDKLGGSKDAIIMTSGGNNVGLYAVIDACIYHSVPWHDYGAQYPTDGECKSAITNATRYIDERFKDDLRNTYNDMLATEIAKVNANAKFYHTGYARFFNISDDDWCDSQSFSVPCVPFNTSSSSLTKELRQTVNNLTLKVNDAIESVTSEDKFKNRFGYIDIDHAFETHRFCEPRSNIKEQYASSNIWLWNLIHPVLGPINSFAMPDSVTVPSTTHADPDNITWEDIGNGAAEVFLFGDTVSPVSGHGGKENEINNGWRLRPFHPTDDGHTGIKDAIIQRLRDDNIPGTMKITASMCQCDEDSCNYSCCSNGTCPPS